MNEDWRAEALSRKPVRIDDTAGSEALASEFGERLEALLASHMLEPTAEGWRQLALVLAMKHEPAFMIETPADRASLGGRPATHRGFLIRSAMKQEMKKAGGGRGAQAKAAKVVAQRLGVTTGTAANAMSLRPSTSDAARRAPYERKAFAALLEAAKRFSQE